MLTLLFYMKERAAAKRLGIGDKLALFAVGIGICEAVIYMNIVTLITLI